MIGLPRPITIFNNVSGRYGIINGTRPIPWQSERAKNSTFNVIAEREKKVYLENRCPYCGVQFSDDENVIRWIRPNVPFSVDRIKSDHHPFHLSCMKQVRQYCPFMEKLSNKNFETGIYKELFINALQDIQENN